VKPVIVTNGLNVDSDLLKELREAGLFGCIFHVDSHQTRPGWEGADESKLNALREQYAELAHEYDLLCSFNTTLFPDTVHEVPSIVQWALSRIDIVHSLTLIAVRMMSEQDNLVFRIGGVEIDIADTPYLADKHYGNLSSFDIYSEVKKVLPDFEFNSFLGGTSRAGEPKWLMGTHIGASGRSFGVLSPNVMEIMQNGSHFFHRRYLSFVSPRTSRKGKLLLALWMFDHQLRRAAGRYLKSLLRSPLLLFRELHSQTIVVLQPVDILATGERDDCDGCPNKTYWNGRLVSACRLEEYLIYGEPIQISYRHV
jgi:hypothetical protein